MQFHSHDNTHNNWISWVGENPKTSGWHMLHSLKMNCKTIAFLPLLLYNNYLNVKLSMRQDLISCWFCSLSFHTSNEFRPETPVLNQLKYTYTGDCLGLATWASKSNSYNQSKSLVGLDWLDCHLLLPGRGLIYYLESIISLRSLQVRIKSGFILLRI